MGLAVLPARLKDEMKALKEAILNGSDIRSDEVLSKHADWTDELKEKYVFNKDNIDEIIEKEIGVVFSKVLEDAGVYKRTEEGKEAFMRFVNQV
jgi:UDPglucose--hexose-1-phosphate uridylyltransferase